MSTTNYNISISSPIIHNSNNFRVTPKVVRNVLVNHSAGSRGGRVKHSINKKRDIKKFKPPKSKGATRSQCIIIRGRRNHGRVSRKSNKQSLKQCYFHEINTQVVKADSKRAKRRYKAKANRINKTKQVKKSKKEKITTNDWTCVDDAFLENCIFFKNLSCSEAYGTCLNQTISECITKRTIFCFLGRSKITNNYHASMDDTDNDYTWSKTDILKVIDFNKTHKLNGHGTMIPGDYLKQIQTNGTFRDLNNIIPIDIVEEPKQAETNTVEPAEMLVGGWGSCWKAVVFEDEDESDLPITTSELLEKIDYMDKNLGEEGFPTPMFMNSYRYALSNVNNMMHIEINKKFYYRDKDVENFKFSELKDAVLKFIGDNPVASIASEPISLDCNDYLTCVKLYNLTKIWNNETHWTDQYVYNFNVTTSDFSIGMLHVTCGLLTQVVKTKLIYVFDDSSDISMSFSELKQCIVEYEGATIYARNHGTLTELSYASQNNCINLQSTELVHNVWYALKLNQLNVFHMICHINNLTAIKFQYDELFFGVSFKYFERNHFFDYIDTSVDTEAGRSYVDKVSNYDDRIINNTMSRTKFTYLVTTKPSEKIIRPQYEDLAWISQVNTIDSLYDDDFTFLYDICAIYAYNNCIPVETDFDDEVALTLVKQPWFKLLSLDSQTKTFYITTKLQAQHLVDYEFVFLICPIVASETSGTLINGMGTYSWAQNTVIWCMHNMTEGKTITYLPQLLYEDVVECNLGKVQVLHRKRFTCMQVLLVTINKYSDLIKEDINETRTFEIPVVKTGILNHFGLNMFGTETTELNKKLLNDIYTKNLPGNLSREALVDYGISLSIIKYGKSGADITKQDIDTQSVRSHVYVAQVLRFMELQYDKIAEFIFGNGLPTVTLAAVSAIVTVFLENTNLNFELVRTVINNLKGAQVKNSLGLLMNTWGEIDIWANANSFTKLIAPSALRDCKHHIMCTAIETGMNCHCCKKPTAIHTGWCRCCSIFVHDCNHVCVMDHSGDYTCDHCGFAIETENGCICCENLVKLPSSDTYVYSYKSPDSRYNILLGKHCQKPTWDTKALKNYEHVHKCETCGKYYKHKHHYWKISHDICDEDCPWCYTNTNPVSIKCNEDGEPTEKVPPKTPIPKWPRHENIPSNIDVTPQSLSLVLSMNVTSVLLGKCDVSNIPNPSDGKLSSIPFVPGDAGVVPSKSFRLINVQDVTVDTDCGIACLKYYLGGDNITDSVVKHITRKTQGLSSLDLNKVLAHYGVNGMVVDASGVWFKTVNDSENYACIVRNNVVEYPTSQHWLVCNAKRMEVVNNEYYGVPNAQKNKYSAIAVRTFNKAFNNLDMKQIIYVNYVIANQMTLSIISDVNLPSLDQNHWSNNKDKKHDPKEGLFHMNVRKEYRNALELFDKACKNSCSEDELTDPWDITPDNVLDVEYHLPHLIIEYAVFIQRMYNDPGEHCRFDDFTLILRNKEYFIDLSATTLKNHDYVMVLSDGEYRFVKINYTTGGLMHLKLMRQPRSNIIKIGLPKQSILSALMTISAILKCTVTAKMLNECLKRATLTLGVGGSGKSTRISNIIKKKTDPKLHDKKQTCIAVACSHGGLKSLREKIPIGTGVFSFESASYNVCVCDYMAVDECTLIRPFMLSLILTPFNNKLPDIDLYGDQLQVGVVEMFRSVGDRIVFGLHNLTYSNSYQLWKTWRLGSTICNELKKHSDLQELKSMLDYKHRCAHICLLEDEEHTGNKTCLCCGNKTNNDKWCHCCLDDKNTMGDTTFELGWSEDWNANSLMAFLLECNVILCFYHNHVKKIRKLMSASGISIREIATVASYQGREDDVVGVIQGPVDTVADIHVNPGFTISAATRAKKKLKWFSIGCFTSMTPLHKRLGSTNIGFKPIMRAKVLDGLNEPSRLDDIVTAFNNGRTMQPFDIEKFNSVMFMAAAAKLTKNVPKMRLRKDGTNLIFEARVLNRDWYFKYDGKTYESDMLTNYAGKVKLLFDNCCFERDDEALSNWSSELNKVGRKTVRVMACIATIYEANGATLTFDYNGNKYDVKKLEGCAACCGLEFWRKSGKINKLTTVNKDYFQTNARLVVGENIEEIKSLLESYDECNRTFNVSFFNQRSSHAILVERINTFIKDRGTGVTNYYKVMHYYTPDNAEFCKRVNAKLGTNVTPDRFNDMSKFPIWKRSNKLLPYTISVWTNDEGRQQITRRKLGKLELIDTYINNLEFSQRNLYDVIPKIISSTYQKFVGTKDDKNAPRLPGMIHNLEWHRQRKTPAYGNLSNRMGMLKIGSLKYQTPLIYVPTNVAFMMHDNYNLSHVGSTNEDNLENVYSASGDCLTANLLTNQFRIGNFQLFGSTSYSGYINDRADMSIKASSCEWDGASLKNYRLSEINYKKMLAQHLLHVAPDSEMTKRLKNQLQHNCEWNGTFKISDYVMMGPSFLSCDLLTFNKILDSTTHMFLWCYTKFSRIDGMTVNINGAKNHVHIAKGEYIAAIEKGKPLKLINQNVYIHLIKNVYDLNIYEVKSADHCIHVEQNVRSGRFISIEYPTILLDPETAISSKRIIEPSTDIFDRVIVSKLTFRVMRDGTTPQDLLVYARTLLNTTSLDVSDYHARYNLTPFAMKKHVRLAMWINYAETTRYSLISQNDVELADFLKNGLLTVAGKFLDKLNLQDIFTEIVTNLNVDNILGDTINVFFKNLDILKPTILDNDRAIQIGGRPITGLSREFNDVISLHLRRLNILKPLVGINWAECDCEFSFAAMCLDDFLKTKGIVVGNDQSGLLLSKCGNGHGGVTLRFLPYLENKTDNTKSFINRNIIYISLASIKPVHRHCLQLKYTNSNLIQNKKIQINNLSSDTIMFSIFKNCKVIIMHLNPKTLNVINNCSSCDIIVPEVACSLINNTNNKIFHVRDQSLIPSYKFLSVDYNWHNDACLNTILKYFSVSIDTTRLANYDKDVGDELSTILSDINGVECYGVLEDETIVGACSYGYIVKTVIDELDYFKITTFNCRFLPALIDFNYVETKNNKHDLYRTIMTNEADCIRVIDGEPGVCDGCKQHSYIQKDQFTCVNCINIQNVDSLPVVNPIVIDNTVSNFTCYVYLDECELLFCPFELKTSIGQEGAFLLASPTGKGKVSDLHSSHTGTLDVCFSLQFHDDWVNMYGKSDACSLCYKEIKPKAPIKPKLKLEQPEPKRQEKPTKTIPSEFETHTDDVIQVERWRMFGHTLLALQAILPEGTLQGVSPDIMESWTGFKKFLRSNLLSSKTTSDKFTPIRIDNESPHTFTKFAIMNCNAALDCAYPINYPSNPVLCQLLKVRPLSQDHLDIIRSLESQLMKFKLGNIINVYCYDGTPYRLRASLPGSHIMVVRSAYVTEATNLGFHALEVRSVSADCSNLICCIIALICNKPAYIHTGKVSFSSAVKEHIFKVLNELPRTTMVTSKSIPSIETDLWFVYPDREPIKRLDIVKVCLHGLGITQVCRNINYYLRAVFFTNPLGDNTAEGDITWHYNSRGLTWTEANKIHMQGAGDMSDIYLNTIKNSNENFIEISGPYGTGKTKAIMSIPTTLNKNVLMVCDMADKADQQAYMTSTHFGVFCTWLNLSAPFEDQLKHENKDARVCVIGYKSEMDLININNRLYKDTFFKYIVFDEFDATGLNDDIINSKYKRMIENGKQVIWCSTTMYDDLLHNSLFDVNLHINYVNKLPVVDVRSKGVGSVVVASNNDLDWVKYKPKYSDEIDDDGKTWHYENNKLRNALGTVTQGAMLEDYVKLDLVYGTLKDRGCTLDVPEAHIIIEHVTDSLTQLIGRFGRCQPATIHLHIIDNVDNRLAIDSMTTNVASDEQISSIGLTDNYLMPGVNLTLWADPKTEIGAYVLPTMYPWIESKPPTNDLTKLINRIGLIFTDSFLEVETNSDLRAGTLTNNQLRHWDINSKYVFTKSSNKSTSDSKMNENRNKLDDKNDDNIHNKKGKSRQSISTTNKLIKIVKQEIMYNVDDMNDDLFLEHIFRYQDVDINPDGLTQFMSATLTASELPLVTKLLIENNRNPDFNAVNTNDMAIGASAEMTTLNPDESISGACRYFSSAKPYIWPSLIDFVHYLENKLNSLPAHDVYNIYANSGDILRTPSCLPGIHIALTAEQLEINAHQLGFEGIGVGTIKCNNDLSLSLLVATLINKPCYLHLGNYNYNSLRAEWIFKSLGKHSRNAAIAYDGLIAYELIYLAGHEHDIKRLQLIIDLLKHIKLNDDKDVIIKLINIGTIITDEFYDISNKFKPNFIRESSQECPVIEPTNPVTKSDLTLTKQINNEGNKPNFDEYLSKPSPQIIVADPGVGKTTWALQLSKKFDKTVLLVCHKSIITGVLSCADYNEISYECMTASEIMSSTALAVGTSTIILVMDDKYDIATFRNQLFIEAIDYVVIDEFDGFGLDYAFLQQQNKALADKSVILMSATNIDHTVPEHDKLSLTRASVKVNVLKVNFLHLKLNFIRLSKKKIVVTSLNQFDFSKIDNAEMTKKQEEESILLKFLSNTDEALDEDSLEALSKFNRENHGFLFGNIPKRALTVNCDIAVILIDDIGDSVAFKQLVGRFGRSDPCELWLLLDDNKSNDKWIKSLNLTLTENQISETRIIKRDALELPNLNILLKTWKARAKSNPEQTGWSWVGELVGFDTCRFTYAFKHAWLQSGDNKRIKENELTDKQLKNYHIVDNYLVNDDSKIPSPDNSDNDSDNDEFDDDEDSRHPSDDLQFETPHQTDEESDEDGSGEDEKNKDRDDYTNVELINDHEIYMEDSKEPFESREGTDLTDEFDYSRKFKGCFVNKNRRILKQSDNKSMDETFESLKWRPFAHNFNLDYVVNVMWRAEAERTLLPSSLINLVGLTPKGWDLTTYQTKMTLQVLIKELWDAGFSTGNMPWSHTSKFTEQTQILGKNFSINMLDATSPIYIDSISYLDSFVTKFGVIAIKTFEQGKQMAIIASALVMLNQNPKIVELSGLNLVKPYIKHFGCCRYGPNDEQKDLTTIRPCHDVMKTCSVSLILAENEFWCYGLAQNGLMPCYPGIVRKQHDWTPLFEHIPKTDSRWISCTPGVGTWKQHTCVWLSINSMLEDKDSFFVKCGEKLSADVLSMWKNLIDIAPLHDHYYLRVLQNEGVSRPYQRLDCEKCGGQYYVDVEFNAYGCGKCALLKLGFEYVTNEIHFSESNKRKIKDVLQWLWKLGECKSLTQSRQNSGETKDEEVSDESIELVQLEEDEVKKLREELIGFNIFSSVEKESRINIESLFVSGSKMLELPKYLVESIRKIDTPRQKVPSLSALDSTRYSYGRQLTALSSTHFTFEAAMHGVAINNVELQFLKYLWTKWLGLAIPASEVVHLYSLAPGKCMRSPINMSGRHIHIGVRSEEIDRLGFETLALLNDPGRLGACLRLVIGMLIPNVCYIHSGRPSYHVLCMERMQCVLPIPRCTTVYSCCSTLSPYMDGMVLVKRPDFDTIARCITSQLVYGDIYGTDECNLDWFNIEHYYIISSSLPYSNVKLFPKYKYYKDKATFSEVPKETWSGWYDLGFCKKSYINPDKYHPICCAIDSAILPYNSRTGKGQLIKKSVAKFIEKNKVKSRKIFSGIVQNFANESISANSYKVYNVRLDDGWQILYDPHGAFDCVANCIRYALQDTVTRQQCDTILAALHVPKLVAEEQILAYLKMLRLNFCLIQGNQGTLVVYNENLDTTIYKLERSYQHKHLMVVKGTINKLSEIKPNCSMMSIFSEEEGLCDKSKLTLNNYIKNMEEINSKYKCSDTQLSIKQSVLNNLKARLHGRVDMIMERNEGARNYSFKTTDCDTVVIEEPKMKINRFYIILSGSKCYSSIPFHINGLTLLYCPENNKFDGVVINPGVSIRSMTWIQPTIRYIRTESIGFLNRESKRYSLEASLPNSATQINCNADTLIIYNYDNREHHNENFINIVNGKNADKLVMSEWWTGKRKDLLKYNGTIRLACRSGKPYLNYIMEYNLAKLIELHFSYSIEDVDDEQLTQMLSNCERWGWDYKNNQFQPTRNELMARLIEGQHDISKVQLKVVTNLIAELYGVQIDLPDEVVELSFKKFDGKEPNLNNNYGIYFDNRTFHNIQSFYTMNIAQIAFAKNVKYGALVDENAAYGEFIENETVKFNQVSSNFRELKEKTERDTPREIPESTIIALKGLDALRTQVFEDSIKPIHNVTYNFENKAHRFIGNGIQGGPISGEVYEDHPTSDTVNYWDDESGMMDIVIPLPNHRISLKKKEEFDGFKFVNKSTMTRYPEYARPSWNQLYGAGVSAVSTLYGGQWALRQVQHDPKLDAALFAETYFAKPATNDSIPKLGFNYDDVITWLKDRPDFIKISKEIDEVLSSDLVTAGLRKVNVHLKLESRVKDVVEAALTNENGFEKMLPEQRVRLIMWQRKGITALFSPTFMKCKDKLKECLIPKVKYVDGLTALEISEILKNVDTPCDIVEDDLSKQDRQTDETIIDTEMEIYKLLGVSEDLVDMWRRIHAGKGFRWYAKGASSTFLGEAMRHTGQATTALGNVIVNLLVRMKLVRRLGDSLKLMLVLGDDNISLVTKDVVTKEMVSENSARHFNMRSKPRINNISGCFLRMNVHMNSTGRYECSPDFIRLQRRFEVTNGVSESSEENIRARSASYLCMLGKMKQTEELAKELGYNDLPLGNWYEYGTAVKCVANYYNMTENKVEGHLNHLLNMIKMRKVYIKSMLMPVSKKN